MIRLYAPTQGDGSLAIVGRGIASAAEKMGLLAGIFPLDASDPYAMYPGADAPVAIVVGAPGHALAPRMHGMHQHVVFEYAPNSEQQPSGIRNQLAQFGVHEVITPSGYGQRVLTESGWGSCFHITKVLHGVDEAFAPVPSRAPKGTFVIFHYAGSEPERKGTQELLEAVNRWNRSDVRLRISCSFQIFPRILEISRMYPSVHCEIESMLSSSPPWPQRAIDQYAECHLVCQPSRSEGFGLVPLEALACGVPAAITMDTGHIEHVEHIDDGLLPIWTEGTSSPMHCEMGGMAPIVSPDAILRTLKLALNTLPDQRQRALDAAEAIRTRWSWHASVGAWLYKLKERFSQ